MGTRRTVKKRSLRDSGTSSDDAETEAVITDQQLLRQFGNTLDFVNENFTTLHISSALIERWMRLLAGSTHPEAKRTLANTDQVASFMRRVRNRDSARFSRAAKQARVQTLESTAREFEEFKKRTKEALIGELLGKSVEEWTTERTNMEATITRQSQDLLVISEQLQQSRERVAMLEQENREQKRVLAEKLQKVNYTMLEILGDDFGSDVNDGLERLFGDTGMFEHSNEAE